MISVKVRTAHVSDKKSVPDMVDNLKGALYGDKGYISSSLEEILAEKGISLITNTRKNMKQKGNEVLGSSYDEKTIYHRQSCISTKNTSLIDPFSAPKWGEFYGQLDCRIHCLYRSEVNTFIYVLKNLYP
uniref:transposase n=2 Tax=Candidatus Enterovibrio escicola TaxID=1927127 RepID=UPI000BE2402C|nr:transposase [Candidatus Enterovibrio escacola]